MTSGELGEFEPQHNTFVPTREYVSEAVTALRKQHDVVTDQRIAEGYRDFFNAIFNRYTAIEYRKKVISHVATSAELDQTKKIVGSIFLQCTLSEPTKTLHRADGRTYENWGPVCGSKYNSTLNPTQIYVIVNHFGLLDGTSKTLKQISEELGKSPVRIRQIEAQAFRHIRHPSSYEKLTPHIFEVKWKQKT